MDNFKKILVSYPKIISQQIEYEKSSTRFVFGGGESTESVAKVKLPVYIKDEDDKMHLIFIATEVGRQDIIFLMGGSSLKKAGALIDCGKNCVTLTEVTDRKFPLLKLNSGHMALPFFPMTDDEGREAARYLLDNCPMKIPDAIQYVLSVPEPKIELILINKPQSDDSFNRRRQKKTPPELSRKDILKLHQFFGHASATTYLIYESFFW